MLKAGAAGILSSVCSLASARDETDDWSKVVGNTWPTKYTKGIPVPGNVKPEEWDGFRKTAR